MAMGEGLMGVGWPRAGVLFNLTLHPGFGLFWQSPALLLALPGLVMMVRDPEHRRGGLVILVAATGLLLVNSGYYMWWGGYAVGPRHLIPVLFLLGVPLAHAARRVPWPLLALLTGVGVAQMMIVTATEPQLADAMTKRLDELPLFGFSTIYSLAWPRLVARELARNLGQVVLGLHGLRSLAPPLVALAGAGVWLARRRA